jgi:hypothetical protein
MKRQIVVLLSSLIFGFGGAGVSSGQGHLPPPSAEPAAAVATEESRWRLVWADEFDTDRLPAGGLVAERGRGARPRFVPAPVLPGRTHSPANVASTSF